jgi:hypothetical protein
VDLDAERRSRRTFSESDPGAKGFVDPVDQAIKLRAVFVTIFGIFAGGLVGMRAVSAYGIPGWLVPVTALAGGVLALGGYLGIVLGSGRLAQNVYAPSGATTPRRAEYSYAESLSVRGDYEGSIAAFELCVAENPADPAPYLRIARIYRDELEDLPNAERWFKRMGREPTLERGMDVLARRELIALYQGKMGAPARAAPVLARMAQEYEGSPEGEWAAAELLEVKALIAEENTPG